MPGVADVLRSLAAVFARAKIRWYLFGAQADGSATKRTPRARSARKRPRR
jgi:hypothetical protein